MPTTAAKPDGRARLLDAALSLMRAKGYSATTVDVLCGTAGVARGAFILAKARGRAEVAAESIGHLRRYIELLFRAGTEQEKQPADGDSK